MRFWALAFGILVVALAGAQRLSSNAQVYQAHCCSGQATPTPTPGPTPPPLVIKWAMNISGNVTNGTPDMGATPDANFMWLVSDQSQSFTSNGCKIADGCHLHKYVDFLHNNCNTHVAQDAATAGQNPANETFFLHVSGGDQGSGNREVDTNTPSTTCASFQPSPKPSNGAYAFIGNPGDAGFIAWLPSNAWQKTATNYWPQNAGQPLGFYEDTSGLLGQYTTGIGSGAAGTYPSGEYSIGFQPGCNNGNVAPVNFIGLAGTTYGAACGTKKWAGYVSAIDYQTALANFANSACGTPTCLTAAFNGASTLAKAGSAQPCNIIVSGHCNNAFIDGDIDDQYQYDTLYNAVASGSNNLLNIETEKPIMGQCNPDPPNPPGLTCLINPPTYASPTQLAVLLNGIIRYKNYADCSHTKMTDYEYGFGTGGPAVPADSTQIQHRTFMEAARWLVPDLATGLPDCWLPRLQVLDAIPHNFDDGGPNESPSFFELTLVPWQPEQTTSNFVWNGSVVTVGGLCDYANSASPVAGMLDTHGVGDLLAGCNNTGGSGTWNSGSPGDGAGIYCQQYKHMYLNGVDKGKAAACINTSATADATINVTNSANNWFKHDVCQVGNCPYAYTLTLGVGELTCLPLTGVNFGNGVCPSNNNWVNFPTCTDANCVAYPANGGETTAWSPSSPGTICAAAGPPCGIIFLQNALP